MNEPGKSSVIRDYLATQKGQELKKWIDDNLKANTQNENAMRMLKEAIQTAAGNPLMTPEVKEIAKMFVLLIEDRKPFEYDFDSLIEPIIKIVEKDTKSQSGSHAANVKHEEGNKRREEIRAIWAEGKYSSRSDCAEQEWCYLEFGSYDTARKALKNTPNPSPWPAKKKS